jgi:hypothetical protein
MTSPRIGVTTEGGICRGTDPSNAGCVCDCLDATLEAGTLTMLMATPLHARLYLQFTRPIAATDRNPGASQAVLRSRSARVPRRLMYAPRRPLSSGRALRWLGGQAVAHV